MKKQVETITAVLEFHEGKYGEYYRFKIGNMYVEPCMIGDKRPSNKILYKHITNLEKQRVERIFDATDVDNKY